MKWLGTKLRKWLGIELLLRDVATTHNMVINATSRLDVATTIGVDVHFKSPHIIIIFSKLNGGQIRHIDAQFNNIKDLQRLVKELEERYKPGQTVYDMPSSLRHIRGGKK